MNCGVKVAMARWKKTDLNQAAQFQRKREAVLREAGRAFARRGFHNTSLDDVARALDVTKAALYTYVTTKQEILFECHKASMDLGDAALDWALTLPGDAAARLEAFLARYIADVTGEDGFFAVLTEIDALTPEDRVNIIARRDDFERRFVELLRQGVADGSLAEVDPKIAIFSFMGTMHWLARWFDPAGRLSSAEMARQMSALMLHGIGRPVAAPG
jgi:TetR/AcrR family transcriptional regulator